ncbi:phenylalanine--tRNA ligase subunit beta [Tundrisphaera lichenicola]|uniref:phenylalanine--tRNA ligase subunit beta n=1 Tax=Tundrisphaera lichenicola TaxID=2029860 RepID=UPI003EBF3A86
MIVSWNWLSDYLRLDMPVEVLSERLMLSGLNHESTEEVGGDLAIDLEVTSNRPDCLAHLGVAREIGVLFDRPVRFPDPRPATGGVAADTIAGVGIEAPDLCSRFTARVVTGVKVGESPWWMRKRLETLGVRPISNVVDVTNYVMLECGQPLHAYDLAKVEGRSLIARRARKGERLRAINGKDYELTPEMLVIADAARPVGLAGVMGGLETEIGPGTVDVLIEAARFAPLIVRRTSRALGLTSDSSYRFERPIDPEVTEWASRRCAELILATAGGTLHPGLIDAGSSEYERPVVTLRLDQIARVLGITIDPAEVSRILLALGLHHEGGPPEAPMFRAPSWRSDLEREIDLIEEVARIHGYDHIPEDRPVPLASSPRGPRERVEDATRSLLTGLGFEEAVTLSFVPDELVGAMEVEGAQPPIRVEHSVRKRANALRQSLVPSLLAVRKHNEAHGNLDVDLFEIANVYLPRPGHPLPDEPTRLTLVSGRDFLGLKGIVEAVLARFHLEGELEVRPSPASWFTPGRSAELLLKGTVLGRMGEIDRSRLDGLDLKNACSAAELTLGVLVDRANLVPTHRAMPTLPAVARDLSLMVPRDLPWAELAGVAGKAGGPMLESIVYLDAFRGGNVPEGRQSIHFGLRFRHPERTLTGEEVEKSVQAIVEACATSFEATLRS